MKTAEPSSLLRPRWRKVLSDLWGDKTRTALVVASIAAGVFAIGMIITAYAVLSQDINRNYAAVNPPNIVVSTDPFNIDLLRALARMPGVRQVEGRFMLDARARKGNASSHALTLVGLPDSETAINKLLPMEGRATPGTNELVISENLINISPFHPGDRIIMELPGGMKYPLTVVGLVADQTTSRPNPNSSNNAFITPDTQRKLGLGSDFNHLYITVSGAGSDRAFISAVAAAVNDQVKNSGRQVYQLDQKLSTEHPMTSTVLAMIGVLAALGGLITILSSSLIVNTLNALLAQQLRQIGVMKLVGGRSIQILGMYLVLILGYSLIALLLAVPLAALAGYGLAAFIATLVGAIVGGFRIIPAALLVQVLIAILIPLGAGFLPVHNGATIKVHQALSNIRRGHAGGKASSLGLRANWLRWFPRPILLSFRNTFRQRARLLLTIFTLTVAGGVFIAVFNARDSMSYVMDQLMQYFMGDVTVNFNQPYDVSRVERDLLAVPGVRGVEAWGGASAEVRDANGNVVTNLAIVAPPQDTQLLHPDFVAGRWLLPGESNAIIVSDTIYAAYPNLKPGDTLRIKIPQRPEEQWTVVGIFRYVKMLGDPIAYTSFSFLGDQTYQPYDAASYRIITNTHEAVSQHALIQRMDGYLIDRGYSVQGIESGISVREIARQAISILVIFLLIMAVLTAFVGSIGLTGTMSINVLERTREIGIMRTIGAVDAVVMQAVMVEALIIGLITWVLAVGLSFPISQLLLSIIGNAMMGSAVTLSFTPLGILLWLVIVAILSVVASILPARRAARLTINEVLAYE
jgi:putative ABC transport system permease protein